jgi:hypothetical protein
MPRWAKLGLLVAVYIDDAACPGELPNHEDFPGCRLGRIVACATSPFSSSIC